MNKALILLLIVVGMSLVGCATKKETINIPAFPDEGEQQKTVTEPVVAEPDAPEPIAEDEVDIGDVV